jgi:CRISPR-associated protein Csc2
MSILDTLTTLNQYREYLQDAYSNLPYGRYVSLVIIRKTASETIFRTEGSGEGLTKDLVTAGLDDKSHIRRVVISKRKQTAVERRTGRELLREHNLLKIAKVNNKEYICTLNANAPCGKCIDCMLYGFAAGGGGAQKSRVMTDDAYSIAPASQITEHRTFNAPADNGTMINPITKSASTAINEDEYVLPETHFLDIETLKDVTLGELQYVIGNVLRSSRYGAITSRLGRVSNTLTALIFSDTEIFSNLELTQAVYDTLRIGRETLPFPLSDDEVIQAVEDATNRLLARVVGRTPVVLRDVGLQRVLDETRALYRRPEDVAALLHEIDQGYQAFLS